MTEQLRQHQPLQPGSGIWAFPARCTLCGYVPSMNGKKRATARANWLRYAMARHEGLHRRRGEL